MTEQQITQIFHKLLAEMKLPIDKYTVSVTGDNNLVITGTNHSSINITQNINGLTEEVIRKLLFEKIKSIIPKHLNHIPLALPPKVIGRQVDLEKVEALLFQDNALVIVNGIGGIGKTVLSHYYWQQCQHHYTHLLWLKGDGNLDDTLLYDYDLHEGLGVAEEMKYHLEAIRQPQNQDAKKQALAFLYKSLKNVAPKALMLIDNATDENHWTIKQWKTTFANFHILVTSRTTFDDVPTHPLGFLEKSEAKELFYLYYDPKNTLAHNDAAVEEIIWFAGYHTLTIELLAKTLKHHVRLTFDSLLEQLKQNPIYLQRATKVGTPYTPTQDYIYNIIELCFDLSDIIQDEDATELLRYFSILPSHNIKGNDLEEMLNITDENENAYLDALKTLVDNGWIQKPDENEYIYDCHTVIQTIVRERLQPNVKNCEEVMRNLNNIICESIKKNPLECEKWLVYINKILIYLSDLDLNIIKLYAHLAFVYQTIGSYNKALTFNLKVVEFLEKTLGKDNHYIAIYYSNLSETYRYLGNYNKAFFFGLKAVTINQKIPNQYHNDIATSYNNFANICKALNKYEDALIFDTKSVIISEKLLGKCDSFLATSYNNLACDYMYLGKYDDALTLHLKVIEIRKKAFGEYHPHLAESYNNIAEVYRYLGNYNKSLKFGLKAIEIREKILNKNHPELESSYSNLVDTYINLGNYNEAIKFALKSKEVCENMPNKYHPDIAISYNNLANAYIYTQNWTLAVQYEKQALEILLKTLPNEHPHIKIAVNTMLSILTAAINAEGREKYEEALQWFSQNCHEYLQDQ